MNFLKSLFYKLNGNHVTDDQNEILEFIANELFSFDDDEIEPPSSAIALYATTCGQKLPQVIASSINVFGVKHACFSSALNFITDNYKTESRFYPGFGHPKYKDFDPRTQRTLEKIATLNYSSVNIQNSCNFAKQVNLPLNIGGLTACILLDCGCNVYNADIFPIICRSVGFTLIHQKAIHKKIKFSSSYDTLQRYNQSNHI